MKAEEIGNRISKWLVGKKLIEVEYFVHGYWHAKEYAAERLHEVSVALLLHLEDEDPLYLKATTGNLLALREPAKTSRLKLGEGCDFLRLGAYGDWPHFIGQQIAAVQPWAFVPDNYAHFPDEGLWWDLYSNELTSDPARELLDLELHFAKGRELFLMSAIVKKEGLIRPESFLAVFFDRAAAEEVGFGVRPGGGGERGII
ncbi:MAG: hypothetical protein AAF570_12605 [Bacteroidota bacterium]